MVVFYGSFLYDGETWFFIAMDKKYRIIKNDNNLETYKCQNFV